MYEIPCSQSFGFCDGHLQVIASHQCWLRARCRMRMDGSVSFFNWLRITNKPINSALTSISSRDICWMCDHVKWGLQNPDEDWGFWKPKPRLCSPVLCNAWGRRGNWPELCTTIDLKGNKIVFKLLNTTVSLNRIWLTNLWRWCNREWWNQNGRTLLKTASSA